jgi:hypothetical protein
VAYQILDLLFFIIGKELEKRLVDYEVILLIHASGRITCPYVPTRPRDSILNIKIKSRNNFKPFNTREGYNLNI